MTTINVFGAIFSALIAVGTYIVFYYGGQPIRRFWDIKGEVAHAVNLYARFIAEPPSSGMKHWLAGSGERPAAIAEFRRLGLTLIAFSENETLATWALNKAHYHPGIAGNLLVELANALDTQTSQGPRRSDLLRPLKLKP